jgi:hypothetical protein
VIQLVLFMLQKEIVFFLMLNLPQVQSSCGLFSGCATGLSNTRAVQGCPELSRLPMVC